MADIKKIKIGTTTYDIDAATVSGFTVSKSVPSDALFTDTTYVFNTTYDESSNKAATMSDISSAIGSFFINPVVEDSVATVKSVYGYTQTDENVTLE